MKRVRNGNSEKYLPHRESFHDSRLPIAEVSLEFRESFHVSRLTFHDMQVYQNKSYSLIQINKHKITNHDTISEISRQTRAKGPASRN
jgi:hypothetical protein